MAEPRGCIAGGFDVVKECSSDADASEVRASPRSCERARGRGHTSTGRCQTPWWSLTSGVWTKPFMSCFHRRPFSRLTPSSLRCPSRRGLSAAQSVIPHALHHVLLVNYARHRSHPIPSVTRPKPPPPHPTFSSPLSIVNLVATSFPPSPP